jgi:hypothetical protein
MMNWSEWENEQDEQRATISPYWLLAFVIFVVGVVLYTAKVGSA